MKRKQIAWLSLALIVGCAFLLVRQHYVLSSTKLDDAIRQELRLGSSKTDVVNFIRARHPLFYDDTGKQVKARFAGVAENLIYRKDIVVAFDFDSEGKLLSHSMKVYLTFL
jgi:hypothetical protein